MSTVCAKLPDFPGFAVEYDPKIKPYFRSQILEDLRRLRSHPLGVQLLDGIANAKPKIRNAKTQEAYKKVSFPKGVNVTVIPADASTKTAMQYMRPGVYAVGTDMVLSNDPAHNNCWCHFRGGSQAAAGNVTAASDGRGCVSVMQYTNAQVITSKGEPAPSFIVLAHELVHSYHHVTGTAKADGSDEEKCTTGLDKYAGEPLSENGFRAAFGFKRRMSY